MGLIQWWIGPFLFHWLSQRVFSGFHRTHISSPPPQAPVLMFDLQSAAAAPLSNYCLAFFVLPEDAIETWHAESTDGLPSVQSNFAHAILSTGLSTAEKYCLSGQYPLAYMGAGAQRNRTSRKPRSFLFLAFVFHLGASSTY